MSTAAGQTQIAHARHWIDGEWYGAPRTPSLDPASGATLGLLPEGGAVEAVAAIGAARRVFDNTSWGYDARLRQDVLLAWADALEGEREALAVLLTRENGKPLAQSRGELGASISEIRYYAGLARHIPGHVLQPERGVLSTVLREPAGVAGIVVPWNAPAVLLVRSLAPALAAGCTAVVKPAAQTSLFSSAMLRAFSLSGLPDGAVNLVHESDAHGYAVSDALAQSHDVDVLSFTGSTGTGKQIMRAAADSVKKLSLELGGKSCCLVFDDTDVEAIAPRLARAATIIAGQQCTAARRILVHAAVAQRMREALSHALAALPLGPGLVPESAIGPLIDGRARDSVEQALTRACERADRVLLRGTRGDARLACGTFLSPTLVEHNDTGAFFCQEKSSVPSSPWKSSKTKPRPCARPTTRCSACPPACGPMTSGARCDSRAPCAAARSRSTITTACSPRRKPAAIARAAWAAYMVTKPWRTSPNPSISASTRACRPNSYACVEQAYAPGMAIIRRRRRHASRERPRPDGR